MSARVVAFPKQASFESKKEVISDQLLQIAQDYARARLYQSDFDEARRLLAKAFFLVVQAKKNQEWPKSLPTYTGGTSYDNEDDRIALGVYLTRLWNQSGQ